MYEGGVECACRRFFVIFEDGLLSSGNVTGLQFACHKVAFIALGISSYVSCCLVGGSTLRS